MANIRGKSVDKTYLSIDNAEDRGFIHRDYIAHCFRWTHVAKRLYERQQWRTARILDVGCGRELPFAKLLYSSKLKPEMYYGVDAGPINDEDCSKLAGTGTFPNTLYENCDFLSITDEDIHSKPMTHIICFEMLEHIEPAHMIKVLRHMQKCAGVGCTFFLSTPCWNMIDCAGNHVNEIKYAALGAVFEALNFHVENVYGTFASIRDYEHLLPTSGLGDLTKLFTALREYYDTNVLSCILAPYFPAQSRNCLWELTMENRHKKFEPLDKVPTPWSSSTKWAELANLH